MIQQLYKRVNPEIVEEIMKENFNTKLYGWFYVSACKEQLRKQYGKKMVKDVKAEYRTIIRRAKDIGPSKLLSAYCMAAYFIALNRNTGLEPQMNYELFRDGLYASRLFHKVLGNADSYLDKKKLPDRQQWSANSHKCQYENDWIVDVLEGDGEYELGYNYLQCGVCRLCQDEGCFAWAKYLCQLDYVIADMMGMNLKRTMTLAEGGKYCDFRYSRRVG